MFEVLVDGVSVTKVENTLPTKYENVKVWVAREKWQRGPHVDGSIRNLKIGSEAEVSINLDNALLYSGGQTISIPQTFLGPVHVEGDLVLETGVSLAKGDLKLNKVDLPYDNTAVTQKVKFDKVSVDDPGLSAPNFSDLPASLVDTIDHVAPRAATSVHIKGKLKIVPDEADVDSFVATGERIGLVNDNVNDHDISDLYDNAAWLSAPDSLPDISSSSVISFDAKFNVDQLQMDKMPPNDLAISHPSGTDSVDSQDQGCNFPIVADTHLKTLSTWGKDFSLSFEILVEAFQPTSQWSEFLRFTTDRNDDRFTIPGIFIDNKYKTVHIGSKVGSTNLFVESSIEAGTWTKFEITQTASVKKGKTTFEVLVDGDKIGKKVVNAVPFDYKEIQVWVNLVGFRDALDGKMRNLKAGKM